MPPIQIALICTILTATIFSFAWLFCLTRGLQAQRAAPPHERLVLPGGLVEWALFLSIVSVFATGLTCCAAGPLDLMLVAILAQF
jgi:hypothetical protein